MLTLFACKEEDFDDENDAIRSPNESTTTPPKTIEDEIFVYQAVIQDSERTGLYTVEGELTVKDKFSRIHVLSYDGAQWDMKVRVKDDNPDDRTVPFYIDLQSVNRGSERFMVHGNVYDVVQGNFNGYYFEENKQLALSYESSKNGKNNISVTITAIAK
jgi:hypothetical protein